MLGIFKKLFGTNQPAQTEKQKFEAENGISHHFGFACHGLLVREFNHHLSYYSGNYVDDFDDLSKIITHKDKIILATENAIANNDVAEKGLIEDETALMNAQNFLKIFKTVVEYNLKFNPEVYYLK